MSERINVTLPDEAAAQLLELCNEAKSTPSATARRLIIQAMQSRGARSVVQVANNVLVHWCQLVPGQAVWSVAVLRDGEGVIAHASGSYADCAAAVAAATEETGE